jgi:glycine betaine/proline transport system ATP-binding protein
MDSIPTAPGHDLPVKIEIKNLYKIFGDDPQGALEHVRNGVGKDQLLEEHNHVLGLENVNIEMREGQITVVMGLSGSGKSTLIRHLNRLIEPTAGEVLVDGEDVLGYDANQLRELRRSRMSMVFQKFALLPHRTIRQNAAMALEVRGVSQDEQNAEADKWLDRVGLGGYGDYYPGQLSGGMQQRVGIARALTSNAEVMLMDEAFSALDPLIRTDMQGLLLDIQKEIGKTIVFITHDLDEAMRLADHLVILKAGRIVQQGEPQRILMKPNDPYIVDFISDINRARVLRVRSVMDKAGTKRVTEPDPIDHDATLEDVIAQSGGDTHRVYRVVRNGKDVGVLDMRDLVKALVRVEASSDGTLAGEAA